MNKKQHDTCQQGIECEQGIRNGPYCPASVDDDYVEGIAEKLNFSSLSYFCRYFRAKTGLSPNAYRSSIYLL